MNAVLKPQNFTDFHVADMALAAWGRKEIRIAETEMPGLMAIREEFAKTQPLKGARVTGCLHMTIQTAVLVETLQALGAKVRWASCNIFSTQDHAAAALVAEGTPVFAYKGETLTDYWDYTHRIFEFGPKGSEGEGPNMILDDGGDATLLMHLGRRAEKDVSVLANPSSEEETCLFAAIKAKLAQDPTWYTRKSAQIIGVTEETTTGVHRLKEMSSKGTLMFRGHQRQRQRHQEQVRQPVRLPRVAGRRHQARHRRDGRRQGGRGGRLRRRGQGLRPRRCARCRRQVWVTEIDPINALQAAMEGYQVVTMDYAADKADIFVTATGNKDVITHEHMAAMKDQAIVCNIGHFDNEIDVASLEQVPVGGDQAAGRPRHLPRRQAHHPAGQGPAGEPGLRHRPPELRDVSSLRQPDHRADRAVQPHSDDYENGKVYVLPKHLDEKVARLHLKKVGAMLTELSEEQAAYIGVRKEGPYKPDTYRY